ncbi:xanthine dehydrogenase accessory protein XdhC [Candidatus Hodarchaeum mangrovi]
MKGFIQTITKYIESGKSIGLVTVVDVKGSAPQRVGAKMIVSADGKLVWGTIGGGTIEALALEQAKNQMKEKKPLLKTFELVETGEEATGMLCGGEMQLFFEVFGATTNIYIFGAGHITQQLIPLLNNLGFSIVIIDDREDYIAENIGKKYSVRTFSGNIPEVIDSLTFEEGCYIIIQTYSHDLDEKILEYLLTKKKDEINKTKYIGMIGSKRKIKEIFSRLEARGVQKQRLDEIHAPIGLSIVSQTPEEIAISIAAELILVRNKED